MKNKKTSQEVKKFLLKTGFPFEMSVAKIFREKGYEVEISPFFLDLEEDKVREIDIIATKEIAGINATFIVECKQSDRDAWIFIAPENDPPRYWKYFEKYMPEIVDFENAKKCFSGLHFFNKKIPLANNYITFNGKKQSESVAINDAVKKSIKGTISTMAEHKYVYDESDRDVFFSAIFFSGDIFLATYNKSLSVKRKNHLLLKNNFISPVYNDISGDDSEHYPMHLYATTLGENISWEEQKKRETIRTAKCIYTHLKPEFIIDVVKDSHIKNYLKLVETAISKIPIKHWINKKSEE